MNTPAIIAERRVLDALHADRQTVGYAAAWLRQNAWQESYAGFGDRDKALRLAGLMESLSVQLDRLPEGLRMEAVRAAEGMIGP